MFSSNSSQVSSAVSYIEDVFSTYLYTGNGSTQTITNNIDLSTKGGLVWIKGRSGATGHRLTDTARGATKSLASETDAAQATEATGLTAFGTTGFTIGADADYNTSSATYASWTFREQPKFFDVVTYTGTGSNTTIAHALGAVPGSIIVKRTDTTADWAVYHRSLANTQYLVLNTTAAVATGATWWNSTTPTSAVFSVGTDASVNASGGTYVAYIFAHDAGGFGLAGTDNVISCGTFTTDGSGNATVSLGYEPQWLMVKASSAVQSWYIEDNMRAFNLTSRAILFPNLSNAEATGATAYLAPNSTGFAAVNGQLNASTDYIYIACRRGPMKVPTLGTSVFSPQFRLSSTPNFESNFVTDANLYQYRPGGANSKSFESRLTDGYKLEPNTTAAESGGIFGGQWDYMNGIGDGQSASTDVISYMFRRAPGFFDEVCWSGDGTSNRTLTHNLTVVPTLIIIKNRTTFSFQWSVYESSIFNVASKYELILNSDVAQRDSGNTNDPFSTSTAPTATQFTLGSGSACNSASSTYVAYLFATCAGVSKVGSYTGTGTTLQIDCGFTAGARFVLIKRTDSTGDWYVWDSARGIIAGDDPYLLLNSTAAEVTNTDYIDTYSAGFEISSTAPAAINASAGTFVFLAIA